MKQYGWKNMNFLSHAKGYINRSQFFVHSTPKKERDKTSIHFKKQLNTFMAKQVSQKTTGQY